MRRQIAERQLARDLVERRHGGRAAFSQGAQERKHLPHPSPVVVIARRGSVAVPAPPLWFQAPILSHVEATGSRLTVCAPRRGGERADS
jgi:hypothetical protein